MDIKKKKKLFYTYIPSLLIEPTIVFPIRFRYIITTIVIVKEVKQYATKSSHYDANVKGNSLRIRGGY